MHVFIAVVRKEFRKKNQISNNNRQVRCMDFLIQYRFLSILNQLLYNNQTIC